MYSKVRSSPNGMGPLIADEFTVTGKFAWTPMRALRQTFANHLDKRHERSSYPLSGAAVAIRESRFRAVGASAAAAWCNLPATPPASPQAECPWPRP